MTKPDNEAPAGLSREPSTAKLIMISATGAVFFSSTFILNYVMHLDGGHWYWSGSLRFTFTIVMLGLFLWFRLGKRRFSEMVQLFRRYISFWIFIGTIGFGFFYAGICFSGDYARGWVVAATWQLIVLASPIIMILLGFSMPKRGILFSAIIVLGVFLVNFNGFMNGLSSDEIIYGVLPIVMSAFTYPFGNQLLNAAKNGTLSYIPHMKTELLASPMVCIFLMSLGSMPFWIILYFFITPIAPSIDQAFGAFMVAFLAGICATGLFLYARNQTTVPYKIAAIDATLAIEVPIPLLFEIIFLGAALPEFIPMVGLFAILAGLVAYSIRQASPG